MRTRALVSTRMTLTRADGAGMFKHSGDPDAHLRRDRLSPTLWYTFRLHNRFTRSATSDGAAVRGLSAGARTCLVRASQRSTFSSIQILPLTDIMDITARVDEMSISMRFVIGEMRKPGESK
jgi:hypothetical protein